MRNEDKGVMQARHGGVLTAMQQTPLLVEVRGLALAGGHLVLPEDKHRRDHCPCPPQPSPSQPVALPPLHRHPAPSLFPWTAATQSAELDLERVSATQRRLRDSGWYYEGMSWRESEVALRRCAPGAFLARDSSDPRFLFSLSVQTERGPTSVRLHYVNGHFRLDAQPSIAHYMPLFECVVALVDYYVAASSQHRAPLSPARRQAIYKEQGLEHVWVDDQGHVYSHIRLAGPLRHREAPPSLGHLARLAVNRCLRRPFRPALPPPLPLPRPLLRYLDDYPYCF
ncbi:cytokine-inducible SH2-containing protein-like [Bacillus rossius redtenbacheri]|uniref:cytokine-inducible SH2-containing protein-like n=1 Tax=Bacillus rossius redtenbacheri TaxID=93214 RepID=UPI002FDEFF20